MWREGRYPAQQTHPQKLSLAVCVSSISLPLSTLSVDAPARERVGVDSCVRVYVCVICTAVCRAHGLLFRGSRAREWVFSSGVADDVDPRARKGGLLVFSSAETPKDERPCAAADHDLSCTTGGGDSVYVPVGLQMRIH